MTPENPLLTSKKGGFLPQVFVPAAALTLLLVLFAILAPDTAGVIFSGVNGWILQKLGWLYALVVTGFLVVAIVLSIGRFGDTKLGPDHSTPDYSFTSWFAMLFSAGMGIGLMFFAVAEPVLHYTAPPTADPRTVEAARQAMQATFFHWGVHGWSIYAIVGLILAYFGFRHRLPLTIRSALYPLIGDRIYGPIGHAVDVFAVLGTLFGVATSLGFGAAQVNNGLGHLFGLDINQTVQVVLVVVISAAATVSVILGLDAGIKRLSELNLILALALLIFVVALGPTILIFSSFVENMGDYASTILDRSLRLGNYDKDAKWIGDWTIFYWGWWISWSPFVGMFIARISRGRTIREFILGVLFVPTLLTFFWMTTFGNAALDMIANGFTELADTVSTNLPVALFLFLDQLPFSALVSTLAILLVITFFVTSSDSGSLVIDTITSGGSTRNPVWQRIFWAITQGLVAIALLLAGGLSALQAMAVATALPFAFVLIFAVLGLLRALSLEDAKARGAETAPDIAPAAVNMPWRTRLNAILTHPEKGKITSYISDIVVPALEDVAKEIQSHDTGASALVDADRAELRVSHADEPDFKFAIVAKGYRPPTFALADSDPDEDIEKRSFRAEVYLSEGGQGYDVYGYSREQLIHEVLNQYNRHMHFLHIARN